ncbi:MAG TPA: hypothetical protein VNS10_11505 [Gemmatimonadaceae bacterium]|jgi:hypothetical protein|nr:hypothetical protein [Gemmatimonadaceae bacterium]
MSSPTPPGDRSPEAGGLWPAYFGIGCITAIGGFAGGGMIAVLVAKVVGALSRCAPDVETGAPCGWGTYWLRGAVIGLVLLPSVALWRFRRGRQREQNPERG